MECLLLRMIMLVPQELQETNRNEAVHARLRKRRENSPLQKPGTPLSQNTVAQKIVAKVPSAKAISANAISAKVPSANVPGAKGEASVATGPETCDAKNHAVVQQLAKQVRQLETSNRSSASESISTGCVALDQCLPNAGYVPGSIVEYLRTAPACGASYLAYAAAASALKARGGFLVVVDTQQSVYPPALAMHGIDLNQVVLVRPESRADAIWATDQALRTPAVAAVVAEIEKVDDRAARRLQLAAEMGNGLGILIRSAAARRFPSWAEVQWMVRSISPSRLPRAAAQENPLPFDSAGRKLTLQLLRNRGGQAGAIVRLAIHSLDGTLKPYPVRERNRHEQAAAVRLATELAGPKSPSRRNAAG